MNLTKEELDNWKMSGEIKRMSHADIVKEIVDIEHAEKSMSKSKYEKFRVLYEIELAITNVYQLTYDSFWSVVADILTRLKRGTDLKLFTTNENVILKFGYLFRQSEYSRWFWGWLVFCHALAKVLGGTSGLLGACNLFFVEWRTEKAFKRKSNKNLTKREKFVIYFLHTLLYFAISFGIRFLYIALYTTYYDYFY